MGLDPAHNLPPARTIGIWWSVDKTLKATADSRLTLGLPRIKLCRPCFGVYPSWQLSYCSPGTFETCPAINGLHTDYKIRFVGWSNISSQRRECGCPATSHLAGHVSGPSEITDSKAKKIAFENGNLQLVLQVYSVMMMCEVPSVFFKQETAIHPQKDVINEGIAPKVVPMKMDVKRPISETSVVLPMFVGEVPFCLQERIPGTCCWTLPPLPQSFGFQKPKVPKYPIFHLHHHHHHHHCFHHHLHHHP